VERRRVGGRRDVGSDEEPGVVLVGWLARL
jgi:hypothetical protein